MKKTTCYVFLISLLFGSQAFAISVHQSKIADNDNNSSTANNGVDTENKQDDTINTKTGRRWDESYKKPVTRHKNPKNYSKREY
ncbi:MAG TPA: hypothetical protein ENJ32_12015 [Crenotrichaceae bacterium]|nr:hypothetical protein [Crenotrichaceae bacterium]